jgi:hypothetical protein
MTFQGKVRTLIEHTGTMPPYTDNPYYSIVFRIDTHLSKEEHEQIRDAAVITGVTGFQPLDDHAVIRPHTMFKIEVPDNFSATEIQAIADLFVRRANAVLITPLVPVATFSHKH